MSFNKKSTANQTENKTTYPQFPVKDLHCAICGARQVTENRILFTLRGDGFMIMNLALVSKADGDMFIASPNTKYNTTKGETKYAKCAVLFFSKEDTGKIIDTVLAHFAENQKEADFKTPYFIYG